MSTCNTIFYLTRHGKTVWNTKGLIQGHKDSELTRDGENQARRLAKELKNITFDLIFSSDLLRARRTAEIVALEKQLAIQTTKALRERTNGIYEGSAYASMAKYDALVESLNHSQRFTHKSDAVESDEDLVSRMFTFILEAAVLHPGKPITNMNPAGKRLAVDAVREIVTAATLPKGRESGVLFRFNEIVPYDSYPVH